MVSAADEFSLCCEEKDPNCPDTCVCVCVCLCVCVCVCVFVCVCLLKPGHWLEV